MEMKMEMVMGMVMKIWIWVGIEMISRYYMYRTKKSLLFWLLILYGVYTFMVIIWALPRG
jgi:hypothetical protein